MLLSTTTSGEQLSYFRRYGFILQFGTVAQNNQYQLRVFDSNDANNREDELAAQDKTTIRNVQHCLFYSSKKITYFSWGSIPQLGQLA